MPLPTIHTAPANEESLAILRAFPELFASALLPAANAAATRLASRIAETQFRGSPLQTRTGILAGSVAQETVRIGDTIISKIGTLKGPARKYARIQDEGGVIKPVKGKALAIPLPAARTASGRPRFPGGPREAQAKFPDMFLVKRRGKPPVLVRPIRVRGGGNQIARLEPLFVLVRSVTIKPSRWLTGGVQKNFDVWEVAFGETMSSRLEQ